MKDTGTDGALPYIRKVRRGRILIGILTAAGTALLLGAVLLIGKKVPGDAAWIPALLTAVPGALALQVLRTRLTVSNETSFVPLLTERMDPELFSGVLRQTSEGRYDLPYLRASLKITDRFYRGQDEETVRLVTGSRQFWDPSRPEYVSYAVQSACVLGDEKTVLGGLSLLEQAAASAEYARSPAFALETDLFRSLALAACSLAKRDAEAAERHARAVLESGSAGPLQKLYADAYLCLSLEDLGRSDEALPFREEALSASPAFGIQRLVRGSVTLPIWSFE